jgi:hypothetical protein
MDLEGDPAEAGAGGMVGAVARVLAGVEETERSAVRLLETPAG